MVAASTVPEVGVPVFGAAAKTHGALWMQEALDTVAGGNRPPAAAGPYCAGTPGCIWASARDGARVGTCGQDFPASPTSTKDGRWPANVDKYLQTRRRRKGPLLAVLPTLSIPCFVHGEIDGRC